MQFEPIGVLIQKIRNLNDADLRQFAVFYLTRDEYPDTKKIVITTVFVMVSDVCKRSDDKELIKLIDDLKRAGEGEPTAAQAVCAITEKRDTSIMVWPKRCYEAGPTGYGLPILVACLRIVRHLLNTPNDSRHVATQ
jgi:hypothetical protein